ncbi:Monoglyceride lipase-like [Oopsacas minuta]|uniref:Monoglyceride lipase-like n=1 Tax=Oopsacas minuta TaxID=111878 RepID=A0AAV7K3I7_9METZ|nr:Monoglyceride lipase-like [Oopsacas minuta]
MAAVFRNSNDVLTHDNEVLAAPSLEDEIHSQAIGKLRNIADLETRGEFTNADSINVFTCCWNPPSIEIKALLCIVHGYGDHCIRFSGYGEEFAKHGIVCFSQDLVGFGRSGGVRGPVDNINNYVRDVIQQIEMMRGKYLHLPLFIYGHSLGAAISLSVVLEKQAWFNGLIVSGNNMKAPLKVGRVRRLLLGFAGKVYPSMTVIAPDLTRLTRDNAEIEKVRQDPLLAKSPIQVKFGVEMFRYLDNMYPRLNEITLPIFVTHGELDVLCPPENAVFVYDSVSSRDKSVEVWRGCKHNLQAELEPDRSEILSRYVDWILERV